MSKQLVWTMFIVSAGAGAASAQPPPQEEVNVYVNESPGPYSYAWNEPGLRSGIGVGLQVGGGIAGFTSGSVRDTLSNDVEGMRSARAVIGTHIPIGLEVAYIGTAVDIDPLGAPESGTLIGTGVEGALRWNILPHYMFNPYLFAGVGWQRFDVRDVDFNVSDTGVQDKDNLAVYPVGGGLSFRDNGLSLDLRGTFRAATDSDLVLQTGGDTADMHTWDVSAQIGFEM
jgi:opacity protein-like surface antigen